MSIDKLKEEIQKLKVSLELETDTYINAMNERKQFDEVKPLYMVAKFTHAALTSMLEKYGKAMDKIAYSLGFVDKQKDNEDLFEIIGNNVINVINKPEGHTNEPR